MYLNWKKELFTVPNLLSLFRLALIPVYVSVYLHATRSYHYACAAGILGVSCLTDAVDGTLARKLNQITHVGKLLDPLADKITQLTLTILLAKKYPVLNPVLALFVVKELFQLGAVLLHLKQGKALPGALPAGKVCTAVLFVSLTGLVLFPEVPKKVSEIIALGNGFFLTLAFVSYILAYYGKNKKVEDLHEE